MINVSNRSKMRRLLLSLIVTAALASAQEVFSNGTTKIPKKSYVCPPNFMRLSHRCYYFSKEALTWQDAHFKCRDLHSNLAIIKNANQDKLIRRTLSKRTLAPLERWLGGRYDWEQMTWKWASSGKSVSYNGFSTMDRNTDPEQLRWHCIIVDPALQFKWNSRSCLEQKQFICHTKIKIVTSKGKKKLLKQYNVNVNNKLNEIPVPNIPDYGVSNNLKSDVHLQNVDYATRPRVKKRKANKNKNRNRNITNTLYNKPLDSYQQERVRRQKHRDETRNNKELLKWKTYYKNYTQSPLHPKAIVEEYNYVKEA